MWWPWWWWWWRWWLRWRKQGLPCRHHSFLHEQYKTHNGRSSLHASSVLEQGAQQKTNFKFYTRKSQTHWFSYTCTQVKPGRKRLRGTSGGEENGGGEIDCYFLLVMMMVMSTGDGGDRRGGGRMGGGIRQMLMMVIKMKWCVYRKKEATITKWNTYSLAP